jgi:hypothetical protein
MALLAFLKNNCPLISSSKPFNLHASHFEFSYRPRLARKLQTANKKPKVTPDFVKSVPHVLRQRICNQWTNKLVSRYKSTAMTNDAMSIPRVNTMVLNRFCLIVSESFSETDKEYAVQIIAIPATIRLA